MREVYVFIAGIFAGGALSYLYTACVIRYYQQAAVEAHQILVDLHLGKSTTNGPTPKP